MSSHKNKNKDRINPLKRKSKEKRKYRKVSAAGARAKGHAFENFIAQSLRRYYPGARRHLEGHGKDAEAGRDLLDTGDFYIQCKRLREYAPISAINQVNIDPIEGGIALLITKADNRPPMCVIAFDDLLVLFEELHGLRQKDQKDQKAKEASRKEAGKAEARAKTSTTKARLSPFHSFYPDD